MSPQDHSQVGPSAPSSQPTGVESMADELASLADREVLRSASSHSPPTHSPSTPGRRCRFFNTPKGCRLGTDCPYLHIRKDPKSSQDPIDAQPSPETAAEKVRPDPLPEQPATQSPTLQPTQRQPRHGRRGTTNGSRNSTDTSGNATSSNNGSRPSSGFVTTSGFKVQIQRTAESTSAPASASTSAPASASASAPSDSPAQTGSQKLDTRSKRQSRPAAPKADAVDPSDNTGPSNPPSTAARPAVAKPAARSLQNKLNQTTDPFDRAKIIFQIELDQIERRFSALGQYQVVRKSMKETIIAVALAPSDPDFPYDLEALFCQLVIPGNYPIVPASQLTVTNQDIPPALVRAVERGWARKAAASVGKASLLTMFNWLDHNLESLLVEQPEMKMTFVSNVGKPDGQSESSIAGANPGADETDLPPPLPSVPVSLQTDAVDRKDRVVIVAADYYGVRREPPSDLGPSDSSEDSYESDLTASDFESDDETSSFARTDPADTDDIPSWPAEETALTDDVDLTARAVCAGHDEPSSRQAVGGVGVSGSTPMRPRGIHIRLPNLQLDGISVLECTSLSIIVRCSRCKDTIDVMALSPAPVDAAQPKPRILCCPTCKTNMSVAYRFELAHRFAMAIGYLDMSACTPFDLLPSTFVATCASCDKVQHPSQCYRNFVRSQPTTHYCTGCHAKMTLCVDQAKFVKIGNGGADDKTLSQLEALSLARKNKKKSRDEAALVVGTPLPKNGSCSHYRKSYRWFRFPCCGKLFPCDVCHEEQNSDGHEMLQGNRMVCGFCSLEQAYSQKPCRCGKELTRSAGKGYWEGGKGTRDPQRMSRNENKKYSGMHKTLSNKKGRVGVAGTGSRNRSSQPSSSSLGDQ
ncbi:uncharacterized protein BJ171DRAFT_307174 [Polychytrium aggregatum]|uniref:uncharacterized protein n=1 Tax=Polychytrium aggregatum TaxID=110093 RepID=UPI0022FE3407|nr:uncharacterized protein BJ171DRAFT_307174 [Polychytrium aggregatum]KAI9206807.1 hypothetical protein BJ171DRAFT_307174 [Polychytrium aggregatum]